MSIIYEALKKVGQRLPFPNAKKETRNVLLWLVIAAIVLGFLASGVAVALLLSSLSKPVHVIEKTPAIIPSAPEVKPVARPPAAPALLPLPNSINPPQQKVADTFDLKGIMDMGGERIALINDEIMKVGDYINGAKVARITKDTVELFLENKEIILKIK